MHNPGHSAAEMPGFGFDSAGTKKEILRCIEMMKPRDRDAVFTRRVLIVALVAVALGIVWLLLPLLLLMFGATLVALTLQTVAQPLKRIGLGNTAAISATTVFFTMIGGAVAVFFGGDLGQQLSNLDTQLGTVLAKLTRQFGIEARESLIQDAAAAASIAPLIPRVLSWGWSVGQAVFGLALAIVAGLYLALDPSAYRAGVIALVPRSYQQNAVATIADIDKALNKWLGGELISMLLVGFLTGVSLWLVGIQSPLALGILAGLANFVPYLGSIAAAIIVLLIAAGQGWPSVVSAAVVMFVIQQIESNVITPLVIGRAVSILPATALFAMFAMALLFGPLGVLFGFPLAIVADIMIRRLYIRDALDQSVDILGEPAARSDHSRG